VKRLFYKKSQKLCSNEQFKAVLAHRQSAGQDIFRLYVRPNTLPYSRFGVSVGKTAGNSVVRNRLKRLAREVFRLNQHNLPDNWDYVLIIWSKMSKKTTSTDCQKLSAMSYNQFEKIFRGLIEKTAGKREQTKPSPADLRESPSDAGKENG
jgi:ribonuclease P protein component